MNYIIGVLVGFVLGTSITGAIAFDWADPVDRMQQQQRTFDLQNNQRQQMQEQWMDRYTPNLERPC